MLLIGFALLLMSTSWFLRTTIDLHTELDLIKTVRTFLAVLAILIGVKIHQDKAFSSLLSSAYTVGSALLIYELGILVGLIPLALLTMLSGKKTQIKH